MSYGTLGPVLLATICLTIVTVMMDRWTYWVRTVLIESPIKKIDENHFHWTISYALVFAGSLLVCWRLQFNYFAALSYPGQTEWDGYVLTALIMSGGSRFIAAVWESVDKIPGPFRGVMSTIGSILGSSSSTINVQDSGAETAPEPLDDSGEGGIK